MPLTRLRPLLPAEIGGIERLIHHTAISSEIMTAAQLARYEPTAQ